MVTFPIVNTTIFFCFILISAFFSASETAFTAIKKAKLHHLGKKNPHKLAKLEAIFDNPKKLITSILIGNNISNVAASALATTSLLNIFDILNLKIYEGVELILITFIVTTILLIFGEITPKVFALKKPEVVTLSFSPLIYYILKIFSPIVDLFEYASSLIRKIFSLEDEVIEKPLLIDEMKMIIDLGKEEGSLETGKSKMLEGVFELSDTSVREIMTPRTDTVCINVNKNISEAIDLFIEKGFSRIPVFEERIDNILGVIYAKDLLKTTHKKEDSIISKQIRKAVFIPESNTIENALQQMKRAKIHLAIVVDEYGGFAGIVTMEDIIEEIIGEIQDEYDLEDGLDIKKVEKNKYLINARMNIKDLGDYIKKPFPETEEYDTLGGFLLSHLKKLPEKNEKIFYKDLSFVVKEIEKHRIIKLELTINSSSETTASY